MLVGHEVLAARQHERPGEDRARSARRSRSRRARPAMSSSRIPNSSPPNRATVSLGRSAWRRRGAAAASSSSPTWWPRLSLTSLKRSRSRNRIAASESLAAEPRERVLEAVDEQHAVGQPGERVVQRRGGGWRPRSPGARARRRARWPAPGGSRRRRRRSCAARIDWTPSTPNGPRERPSILTDSPARVRRPRKSGCSKRVSAFQSSTTTGAPRQQRVPGLGALAGRGAQAPEGRVGPADPGSQDERSPRRAAAPARPRSRHRAAPPRCSPPLASARPCSRPRARARRAAPPRPAGRRAARARPRPACAR